MFVSNSFAITRFLILEGGSPFAAEKRAPRGEITLLIGPSVGEAVHVDTSVSLKQRVSQLQEESGLDRKAALKQAARERGLGKREAYKQLLLAR